MGFFFLVVLVVLLMVPLTRGSFRRLGRLQFRALWLLLVALILQMLLEFIDFPKERIDDIGFALLLATYVMVFVFCWLNWQVRGMPIVVVGVALNALVITLNQGMPTQADVKTVDGRVVHVPIPQTVKHRPETDATKLSFLGDIWTLPVDEYHPFSIGDVVIGLGVLDICFEASRVPRRRGKRLPDLDPVSD